MRKSGGILVGNSRLMFCKVLYLLFVVFFVVIFNIHSKNPDDTIVSVNPHPI